MPGEFERLPDRQRFPRMQQSEASELLELINRGTEEPIAWELFRQAYELRSHNQGACLVMLNAALEIGTKRAIGLMDPPNATEMSQRDVEPVETLLFDTYQQMIALRGGSEVVALWASATTRESVLHLVDARNRFVHFEASPPDQAVLLRWLTVVRALLYALDAACGNVWARAYLRITD